MSSRRFWLAPLAATLTAGCFATRNDVRLLKADIERMHAEAETNRKAEADRVRAETARRDSASSRRLEVLATSLADTLRHLAEDLSRFRATQSTAISDLQLQIQTVQEIVGVTQQQLRAQAARQEAIREAMSSSGATDSGGAEGPITFYQVGMDQIQKMAWGQARSAFQELLDKFPKDTLVPDAMYQIGVAYSADKMEAKADSVWALIVRDYPKSDRAPGALYKRAFLKAETGNTNEARTLYTRLTREYPDSEEAKRAVVRLRELPRG